VSPFRPFLLSPASVFSKRPFTRQLNFFAAWPSSAFSVACRLLVSLGSLFRTRFLYFQQFAHSFAKTPGVGVPQHIRTTLSFHRHMRHGAPLSPAASLDCAYFLSPRGCTTNTLSAFAANPMGSPFVFTTIQNPVLATPFLSHRSKMPGVWGVQPDFCLSHKGGRPLDRQRRTARNRCATRRAPATLLGSPRRSGQAGQAVGGRYVRAKSSGEMQTKK
jgi:hypothetical protein